MVQVLEAPLPEKKPKNWLCHQSLGRRKPHHPLENPTLIGRWLANDLSQVSKDKPGWSNSY